ncbi:MAG: FeoA family protein [Negativicutes bacterium]|nr:FeoA family protein [Negativicutes bacterium]
MIGTILLTELRPGEQAIVAVLPTTGRHLQKLLVFGILPGMEIKMVQTFPSYVLGVGNTLLALDGEIAASIAVIKK